MSEGKEVEQAQAVNEWKANPAGKQCLVTMKFYDDDDDDEYNNFWCRN